MSVVVTDSPGNHTRLPIMPRDPGAATKHYLKAQIVLQLLPILCSLLAVYLTLTSGFLPLGAAVKARPFRANEVKQVFLDHQPGLQAPKHG